jgi:hypothetical protein
MRVSNSIAELCQQIHDDLRIQHPEWIEPNGECPECDFYEARLMEELDTLTRRGVHGRSKWKPIPPCAVSDSSRPVGATVSVHN